MTNSIKIHKADSEAARLADKRLRIVYEQGVRRPDKCMDLVFDFIETDRFGEEEPVPSNAIYTWDWCDNGDPDHVFHFFTTEERCKEMVAEDPACWTEEKLKKFAEEERSLFDDWANGRVFGYVVEKWDPTQRKFTTEDSLWGMYGVEDLLDNIEDEIEREDSIVVCLDPSVDIGDIEMSDVEVLD